MASLSIGLLQAEAARRLRHRALLGLPELRVMQQQRLGHARVIGIDVITQRAKSSLQVFRDSVRILPRRSRCQHVLCTWLPYQMYMHVCKCTPGLHADMYDLV